MKNLLALLATLVSATNLFAQPQPDQKVILVACKTGELIIDGHSIGQMEAEDAKTHLLSPGEHYVQLKTSIAKFNQAIKVESGNNGIIKIGCESAPTTEGFKTLGRYILVDRQLSLGGTLAGEVEQGAFALQEGDELVIAAEIMHKKGTATITIVDYERHHEIFRREGFSAITNQVVRVPAKGIYLVSVTSNALFDKNVKLQIKRIPVANGDPNFKTSVRRVLDTVSTDVLNTTTRAYSITNARSNRTVLRVILPEKTKYWVYWIGVGQECKEQMKKFVGALAGSAKLFSANPLVLYGFGMIKHLPVLNATSTVSYKFMDSQNGQAFMNKLPYQYLTLKYASNISADFSLLQQAPKDLVLALENASEYVGQDVEIRVVAFQVKARLVAGE